MRVIAHAGVVTRKRMRPRQSAGGEPPVPGHGNRQTEPLSSAAEILRLRSRNVFWPQSPPNRGIACNN